MSNKETREQDGFEPAVLTYEKLCFGSPSFHGLSCLPSWFLELSFPWPLRVFSLVLLWVSSSLSFNQSTRPMPGSCQGERWPENWVACFPPCFPTPSLSPQPHLLVPVLPLRDLRPHEQIVFYRCLCKLKCDFCLTEVSVRVGKGQWQILKDKKRAWYWETSLKKCMFKCLFGPLLAMWLQAS